MLYTKIAHHRKRAIRSFSSKVELAPLPYELSALEPVVSGYLMDFHYNKHHRAYVTNLNALLEQQGEALEKNDHAKVVSLAPNIRFHGGGHVNHTFFWESLAPTNAGGGALPDERSPLH